MLRWPPRRTVVTTKVPHTVITIVRAVAALREALVAVIVGLRHPAMLKSEGLSCDEVGEEVIRLSVLPKLRVEELLTKEYAFGFLWV